MSSARIHDRGDGQRLAVSFTDYVGVPTDPTNIVFKYRAPDEVVTTIIYPASGIVRDSAGEYRSDIILDQSGSWAVRWEGTGDIVAAVEEYLFVPVSLFP